MYARDQLRRLVLVMLGLGVACTGPLSPHIRRSDVRRTAPVVAGQRVDLTRGWYRVCHDVTTRHQGELAVTERPCRGVPSALVITCSRPCEYATGGATLKLLKPGQLSEPMRDSGKGSAVTTVAARENLDADLVVTATLTRSGTSEFLVTRCLLR